MAAYAGVDLGASHVRTVIGDETGNVLGSHATETPRGPTGIVVTEAVLEVLRVACDDAGIDPKSIRAAGIGSIGPLDLAHGFVDNPANLPDTIDRIPLTGPVGTLIDSDDVYLHNDTTAGVIGERFHSERNPDDMVYLTISSGIGAGVAVDGTILAGWDGNAGEVGHMQVDPAGHMPCGCGWEGHWESYSSGNNIPHYAAQLHRDDPVETSLPIEADDFDAATVFAHARDGDEFATSVVERIGHWNAIGVANLTHAFAPLVVYVGGAVTVNNPDETLDPIREHIPEMILGNVPDVELTALGDDVVVMGALASALTGGTGERSK